MKKIILPILISIFITGCASQKITYKETTKEKQDRENFIKHKRDHQQ